MAASKKLLDSVLSRRLIEAGFSTDEPVIHTEHNSDLTFSEFQQALFERTYSKPCSVQVALDGDTKFHLVPELIEAIYMPQIIGQDEPVEEALGYWDHPSWYIRGHILRGVPGELQDYVVHLYLEMEPQDQERMVYIKAQLIPAASKISTDKVLYEMRANSS